MEEGKEVLQNDPNGVGKSILEYHPVYIPEYTKHFQNVSKEYETLVTKQHKIHLRASILICFWAFEPVRGCPGDHPGMGTLKNTQKPLARTLLLEHICDIC